MLTKKSGVTRIRALGMNYMRFAKVYPHLFMLLFCADKPENVCIFDSRMDQNKPYILRVLKENYGMTDQKFAEDAYIKIGIFLHGLAMLMITKSAKISDDKAVRLFAEVAGRLFKE